MHSLISLTVKKEPATTLWNSNQQLGLLHHIPWLKLMIKAIQRIQSWSLTLGSRPLTTGLTEPLLTEESSSECLEHSPNDTDVDAVCDQSNLECFVYLIHFKDQWLCQCQSNFQQSCVIVSSALLAKTEALVAESKCLMDIFKPTNQAMSMLNRRHCSRQNFYAGFGWSEILLAFHEFLGPAVDQLQ